MKTRVRILPSRCNFHPECSFRTCRVPDGSALEFSAKWKVENRGEAAPERIFHNCTLGIYIKNR